jgi:hypothetical protein
MADSSRHRSTGKLMPPLTGIGESTLHHAAVVQIWQRLPVQLTKRSIPTSPDREAVHGRSNTHHLLHATWPISWPHLAVSKGSPCRELPKELVESNTYAVMVLNKPSSSKFVAALCSEDEREARILRFNPRRKIDC